MRFESQAQWHIAFWKGEQIMTKASVRKKERKGTTASM